MKTIREYEASDIDTKNNDAHSFLMAAVLIVGLSLAGRDREQSPDESMKEIIANILNMAEKSGIAIMKAERLPE